MNKTIISIEVQDHGSKEATIIALTLTFKKVSSQVSSIR